MVPKPEVTALDVLYAQQQYDEDFHMNGFTPKSLEKQLREKGFKHFIVTTPSFLILMRAWKTKSAEGQPGDGFERLAGQGAVGQEDGEGKIKRLAFLLFLLLVPILYGATVTLNGACNFGFGADNAGAVLVDGDIGPQGKICQLANNATLDRDRRHCGRRHARGHRAALQAERGLDRRSDLEPALHRIVGRVRVLAGDLFDFDRRHGDLQRDASEYGASKRRLDSDQDKLQRGGRCGEKINGGGDLDVLKWLGQIA